MKGFISGLSFVFVMSLLVMSCGSGSENNTSEKNTEVHEHDGEMHEHHDEENMEMEDVAVNESITVDSEIATLIVENYLAIKNALVKSNLSGSTEAAQNLHNVVEGQDSELMISISESSSDIASAEDVEAQRKSFEKLSANVYKVVKSSELDIALYQQYCPMAFNNKGASWISAEKEVMNPYFGDKMLNCGKVTEEL